jgi:drug/metabolite transporter (DMT)-like permease
LTITSPTTAAVQRDLAHRHADMPLRGILLIVTSTVFLACSDTLAKYLSHDMPSLEIAWIRFAVFTLIMMPGVIAHLPANVLYTARPGLQILRGLGLAGSSILFICGLRYLPIAEASATSFIAPIFVTGLSILFLRESVGKRRWAATIAGLIGVLVIVRPGTAAFHPAAILPIVSALCWAGTLVLTRLISGADRTLTTMTISALVGFVLLTVMLPFSWTAPGLREVGLAVAIGITSTAGQWIVALAYRYGDASVLAPFSYSQLVWVSILGFLVFGEIPDLSTICGAIIIIGSGLYTAQRERARRLLRQIESEPYPSA